MEAVKDQPAPPAPPPPAPIYFPPLSLEERIEALENCHRWQSERNERTGLVIMAFVLGFALAMHLTA